MLNGRKMQVREGGYWQVKDKLVKPDCRPCARNNRNNVGKCCKGFANSDLPPEKLSYTQDD